jgi:hypothetical protein
LNDGHGVDHRVGVGVAETEIGKLQRGCRPIGGKREVIMLEGDRAGAIGAGFGRSDGLIQ